MLQLVLFQVASCTAHPYGKSVAAFSWTRSFPHDCAQRQQFVCVSSFPLAAWTMEVSTVFCLFVFFNFAVPRLVHWLSTENSTVFRFFQHCRADSCAMSIEQFIKEP
jgi:hypothetical protein